MRFNVAERRTSSCTEYYRKMPCTGKAGNSVIVVSVTTPKVAYSQTDSRLSASYAGHNVSMSALMMKNYQKKMKMIKRWRS